MTCRPPKVSTRLRLRVDRREIAYFKFVLEAYEGVAILRTIDPQLGTVELMIGPGCEPHVDRIVKDLSGHIRIETIPQ